jgi:VCBS repeat protein
MKGVGTRADVVAGRDVRIWSVTAAVALAALVAAPQHASAAIEFAKGMPFPVPGNGATAITAGDLNNDGDPDLAVANHVTNDVASFLGGTGTTFTSVGATVATHTGPTDLVMGNFGVDNKRDVAVANSGSDDVSVLRGLGTGSFEPAVNYPVGDGPGGVSDSPSAIARADLTGDGDPDLVVADEGSSQVSVLPGAGGTSFGPAVNFPVGLAPIRVVVGNFNSDQDAYPDVAVTESGRRFAVLFGRAPVVGEPRFYTAKTYKGPVGFHTALAVGDFNLDNDPDLVMASSNSNHDHLAVNFGAPGKAFEKPQYLYTKGGDFGPDATVDDFDINGFPDIAMTRAAFSFPANGAVTVLGAGPGGFAPPVNVKFGQRTSWLASGDFDGDTDADLAVLIGNDVVILESIVL